MSATITFYGGTGTVTGANFLLDTGGKKILIDCGAFEREHVCDPSNAAPFAYDTKDIDALIVTHAHADHIGRIPKLVKDGFKGVIHSTGATKDLADLMFDDAINVMRQDAERHGCDILYEKEDAQRALSLWQGHEYHEPFAIGDVSIELLDAGHILGSAMAKCTRDGKVILFTGDLGNTPEPLLNDTESPAGANYIVMESVYGDRVHENSDQAKEGLRAAVIDIQQRGGTLLIPSFSIERTQILLYQLDEMLSSGGIEPIPVYLDAPLAIRVTEVFRNYVHLFNPAIKKLFANGDDPFTFKNLSVIADPSKSQAIHKTPSPKIIIAGAGMSVGGRIRGHEKQYLPDKNSTILFVGYQAPGSLGRRIQDGEKKVQIDGEHIQIRARIASISGYSGHKDRDALLEFVEQAGQSLEKVFVVMGEPKASMFLAQRVKDFLGVDVVVPEAAQSAEISF